MVTEGPMVGMSSAATPHSNRDAASIGTRFWCQHVIVRTTGKVLQAGDEVADGAMTVSPADKFTKTV